MNPRLYLTTPRLKLRLPHPEDIRSLQWAIEVSINDLARWLPRAIKGQNQRQTRDYIYTQMALFVQDENYVFGIFRQDAANPGQNTQDCIGIAELGPRVREIPSYELGFWIRSDVVGQGYATEACKEVVDYAFTKLKANRVFMRCEPENMPSRRVAEKIGLKQEAWLKNDALGVDGKTVVDTMVFGLTDVDYKLRLPS